MQFPKANTSPSVKTITWVCLLYIIEQCWRESLDAKTSLSCLTTLAHVLNEKVMALKRCQHHETAIFRCGLETVKKPCRIPWIALVFHASGGEVSSGIFSIWRKSQWRLVDGGPCPLTPHFKERTGILHKPLNILNPPSSHQRVRGTFNKRAVRHIQSPFFFLLSPQIVASLLNRCALWSELFFTTSLLIACQFSFSAVIMLWMVNVLEDIKVITLLTCQTEQITTKHLSSLS